MNRDPIASLQRVARMEYEEVESYGLDPEALTYYHLAGGGLREAPSGSQPADTERHYDLQQFLNGSTDGHGGLRSAFWSGQT